MPRKKMKNSAKSKGKTQKTKRPTAAKRTAKNTGLALAQSIEKDFQGIPAKLAALYQKEGNTTEQQAKKLQAALAKATTQNKATKQKQAALMGKTTSTAKKQLAALKKNGAITSKTMTQLASQLEQIKKQVAALKLKQTKFTVLSKELIKLEKQLDAKAKAAAKKPKTTGSKKPAKAKTTKAIRSTSTQADKHDSPLKIEELVTDNTSVETVEMDS